MEIFIAGSNASDKPVLGICKGCQVMNIALGGTIYQDIYEETKRIRRFTNILNMLQNGIQLMKYILKRYKVFKIHKSNDTSQFISSQAVKI